MVVNVGLVEGFVRVEVGTQRPAQFSPRVQLGSVRSQVVPEGQGAILKPQGRSSAAMAVAPRREARRRGRCILVMSMSLWDGTLRCW